MEYSPIIPPAHRYDGFAELLQDVGNTRQFGTSILNLGGAFGARLSYLQGGLMARIVDDPADMSTARGVTIEHGNDEMDAELDRLKVMQCLADGLRWSLLDGGAALIILAKDGGQMDAPLRRNAVLEEFRVVSVVDMRGQDEGRYSDPTKPNYGDPQYYKVTAKRGSGTYTVHESRIIPVPGGPTPSVAGGQDARDVPWAGAGIASNVVRAVERYRRALRFSEALLERSQQAVHKMKGLAEMLMAGQESVVRQRINLVDSNRSALNGVAVDAEDDYTVLSVGLGGVKDILQEQQTAVAAETGWPQTFLFGRSPGGLNSTGEGDWALVYGNVEQLRTRRLTAALERIIALIVAQPTVKNKPEDWKACWNPLAPLTRQQLADVENKEADTLKKKAEAAQTAVGVGMVSEDEAHEWAAQEGLFGLDDGSQDASGAQQYANQTA